MSETAAAPAPSVPTTSTKETLKSIVVAWSETHSVVAPVDPAAKRRNSLLRAKTEAESIVKVLSDVPEGGRPASVSAMLKAQETRLLGIENALADLPKVEPIVVGREAQRALLRSILASSLGIEDVLFV